jgi:ankyrin repeat protein
MTGVHFAAYFGLREAMITLLKNGHDPDSKDNYGRTPLSRAVENGHQTVVKLLLEKGAELESKDIGGRAGCRVWARDGCEAAARKGC